MHHAPSVSYPVGRCVWGRLLWLGPGAVGAIAWAAWGWVGAPWAVWSFMGVGLWLAHLAAWRALRQQRGTLHWNALGGCWSHEDAVKADEGQVKAVLDLQNALLLRWQPLTYAGLPASRWLWLARESQPSQWLALRRAVFARQ